MSRGVRDLRELICVSRLTYRDSDEDEVWSEDEGRPGLSQELEKLDLSEDSGSSSSRSNSAVDPGRRLLSPDSGFVTNGSPVDKTQPSSRQTPLPEEELLAGKSASAGTVSTQSKTRPSKKKRKKRAQAVLPPLHDLPKPVLLPPVQSPSLESLPSEAAVNKHRQNGGRVETESGRGNFDAMLTYMDATIVADWLTRSNTSLEDLTTFCSTGDNFVQFAHFWLTDFPDVQKQEIYEMEHDILVEEVTLAFAVGKESRKVMKRDILELVAALFREYPAKLYSSKGSQLFLDYLDVITSVRSESYKKLLSDVRCSTRNRQYAQWLLATRSFALVSMWSAVVNFYRNLLGRHGVPPGLPLPVHGSASENVSQRRLYQAIRLGFQDVVHYLVHSGHVDLTQCNSHGRSVLFAAVMHNQPQVIKYLTTRVHPAIDVNQPSDTGNTALHAAANSGNLDILQLLCQCPDIEVNCRNPQCENATPLHLAVMHGNAKMVEVLLAAGADPTLKMGSMSAVDVARDFDHHKILDLLRS